MANFGPDAFTVGGNTDVNAYNADYIRITGTDHLIVNATQDLVTVDTSRGLNSLRAYRYGGAGAPTGDQEVLADLLHNGASGNMLGLIARAATDNSENYYIACFRAGGVEIGIRIYRVVAGVYTEVANNGGAGWANSASLRAATFEATGTNPVVLTATFPGVANATYNDIDASRHQSGTPGFAMTLGWNDLALDNFQIIDGAGGGSESLLLLGLPRY